MAQSKITYKRTTVESGEGVIITILAKNVKRGAKKYTFCDVMVGGIIIKGCNVVKGKNGYFMSMPSRENNGEYYPHVYISRDIADALADAITGAEWVETGETYLEFDGKSSKSKKSVKKSAKKAKTEDEDEDGDEDADDYPF